MKTTIITSFILFLFYSHLNAQVNSELFISELQKQIVTLKKTEPKNIKKFMRIGYKQNPELRTLNDTLAAFPIYSIYGIKAYKNRPKVIDSLLLYLDVKKLEIDEILYCKDSIVYASAMRRYKNIKKQAIIMSNKYDADLFAKIRIEKPDLVFILCQSNSVFFFVKANSLYCYSTFCNSDKKLIKYSISEYIRDCLTDSDTQLLTSLLKPSPPIYCK